MLGRLLSNRLQRSGPTFTCVTLERPSGDGKMGKGRGEEGLTWRRKERQVPINRTECNVRERARVGGREFGHAIGSTQRDNWSAGAPRALSALLIINFCQHIDAIYNLLQMVVWSNLPLVAIYVCNTLLCIWWRKMWCKKIDVIVKYMRRLSHTIGYHLNWPFHSQEWSISNFSCSLTRNIIGFS